MDLACWIAYFRIQHGSTRYGTSRAVGGRTGASPLESSSGKYGYGTHNGGNRGANGLATAGVIGGATSSVGFIYAMIDD